jgi:hypothetical protein
MNKNPTDYNRSKTKYSIKVKKSKVTEFSRENSPQNLTNFSNRNSVRSSIFTKRYNGGAQSPMKEVGVQGLRKRISSGFSYRFSPTPDIDLDSYMEFMMKGNASVGDSENQFFSGVQESESLNIGEEEWIFEGGSKYLNIRDRGLTVKIFGEGGAIIIKAYQ